MKIYGILLIGCGHIGREHISDIYYRENIRIVAVVDRDIERARDFAARYSADHADTDYKPYLMSDEVDIVIIATPASCHLEMLSDALSHGKHVLCEKPISSTLEDGRRFVEFCKGSKSHVSVGYILRYNDTFKKVKEIVDSGEIGELRLVRMVQNHHIVDKKRYYSLLRDCTPLLDCGVHYYDMLQWISGGKIIRVGGFSTRIASNISGIKSDYGMAQLYLDNGVVGYYEAGWSESISSQNTKEFVGDRGSITVTLNRFRSSHTEEGDLIEVFRADDGSYRNVNVRGDYKPMYRQLSSLIDKIEGRVSETPSIDDAFETFRVGIAANLAAETRKIIDLSSI